MIVLGISKPRLYRNDEGKWRIAYHHMRHDTTEPHIYRNTGSHIDIPVDSHKVGIMVVNTFVETYRVFPVPTTRIL